MSTLEYTVSMLEAIPEEKLKEVQRYIQYIMFRDTENPIAELLTEDAIVEQLTARNPNESRTMLKELRNMRKNICYRKTPHTFISFITGKTAISPGNLSIR
ncbi:MAG: hypothetical protein NC180_12525 [Muribaculaceae bacterium]|nr:hypothetical protein [bacterium]MCM1494027.1 hypothetical protein [Muribaculaceae bacterium]